VAATPQNYANHRYRPLGYQIMWAVAALALGHLSWLAYVDPTTQALSFVLLALAVLGGLTLMRLFALCLQNRIIRVEMQVRLTRLGRDKDLTRLTMPQLVALRFASDAELPALIDRAIAENLTADQIKRAVTDWQGDHLRT
jgi:hypothetical protein